MIYYGDIEYFALLELQSKLRYVQYDKLDLLNLDRLRAEVDRKIKEIEMNHKNKKGGSNG